MIPSIHLVQDLLLLVRRGQLAQDLDVVEVLAAVVDGTEQQLRQVELDGLPETLAARPATSPLGCVKIAANVPHSGRKDQIEGSKVPFIRSGSSLNGSGSKVGSIY